MPCSLDGQADEHDSEKGQRCTAADEPRGDPVSRGGGLGYGRWLANLGHGDDSLKREDKGGLAEMRCRGYGVYPATQDRDPRSLDRDSGILLLFRGFSARLSSP